jgi:Ca2+/H+ antiporter, TMEM165/GDT1 family
MGGWTAIERGTMLNTARSVGFDPMLFLSTFGMIFVAELPDKTVFATLFLATRHHPLAVFLGVAGAFAVQSLVAVTCGSVLGFLPEGAVHIGAAGLFVAFAIALWLRQDRAEHETPMAQGTRTAFWQTVTSSFAVIFLAEWGDVTQLATAALEAQYRSPLTIVLAAILALWCVTALAIVIGQRLQQHMRPALLRKIAAIACALAGIVLVLGLRRSLSQVSHRLWR